MSTFEEELKEYKERLDEKVKNGLISQHFTLGSQKELEEQFEAFIQREEDIAAGLKPKPIKEISVDLEGFIRDNNTLDRAIDNKEFIHVPGLTIDI